MNKVDFVNKVDRAHFFCCTFTFSSVRFGEAQAKGVSKVHEAGEASGAGDGLHDLRNYAQLGHDLQSAHRGAEAFEEGSAGEEEKGRAAKTAK